METETERLLKELLVVVRAIASTNPPNWQRPLKTYNNFDWSKIGAHVITSDPHGAATVAWCGHVYIRRSSENKKYGAAIWFSRGSGKDDDGEINYLRLITFRNGGEVNVEPLPEYVVRCLR